MLGIAVARSDPLVTFYALLYHLGGVLLIVPIPWTGRRLVHWGVLSALFIPSILLLPCPGALFNL
eukprot:2469999-Ditylum_brightwellii.AAC.1